jgi:hypothetical protein
MDFGVVSGNHITCPGGQMYTDSPALTFLRSKFKTIFYVFLITKLIEF